MSVIMFFITLFIVLFGITLVGVCSFYFTRLARVYLGRKPFTVIEKKARAAMHAADLGWLAIVVGPVVAFLICLGTLPWLHKADPRRSVFLDAMSLFLMVGLGVVAGVILAMAFWMTSTILGKVRNWEKKLGTVSDPDFDGPM